MNPAPSLPRTALALFTGVWAGLVCGVSFIATPAKFLTPNVARPQLFDVGRYVFHASSLAQWGLAALVMALLIAAKPGRLVTLACLAAAACLALQSFWLLPALDSHIDLILANRPAPATIHHAVFAVVEVGKVLALLLSAWLAARPVYPAGKPAQAPVAVG